MKYFELDRQEAKILREFEEGKLKSLPQRPRQLNLYQNYARQTLNKRRNINIRLSEKDLVKIKSKAAAEGLPYQTLMSSVLHRFVSGAA